MLVVEFGAGLAYGATDATVGAYTLGFARESDGDEERFNSVATKVSNVSNEVSSAIV